MTSKKWVIQWNFNVQKWKATTNHKAIPESIPGWGSHSFTHDDDSFFWTPIVSCSSKENSDVRRIYLLNHLSTINGMQLLVWKCLAPTNFKPPQSLSKNRHPWAPLTGRLLEYEQKSRVSAPEQFCLGRISSIFFQNGLEGTGGDLTSNAAMCKVTAFYD